MSRIAILGASGGLGTLLVSDALRAGLRVNALTREPKRVKMANENLTVFQGDADTGVGLARLVTGCRFVVSAVASARPSDAVAHVIQAVGLKKVERLVFVSRLGGAQPHGVKGLLSTLVKPKNKDVEQDLGVALDLVRLSGLAYVVLHTAGLTDERPGRGVAFSDVGAGGPPPQPLGRADLSRFILKLLEEPGWNCREVTVRPGPT